jgi:hypothetical protein
MNWQRLATIALALAAAALAALVPQTASIATPLASFLIGYVLMPPGAQGAQAKAPPSTPPGPLPAAGAGESR